jgi:hypothetical protein
VRIPYSLIGVTAEHFAAAQIAKLTAGPHRERVWVLIADRWVSAPRDAMPLLLGVDDLDEASEAALRVDGCIEALTLDEATDARWIVARAAAQGRPRC